RPGMPHRLACSRRLLPPLFPRPRPLSSHPPRLPALGVRPGRDLGPGINGGVLMPATESGILGTAALAIRRRIPGRGAIPDDAARSGGEAMTVGALLLAVLALGQAPEGPEPLDDREVEQLIESARRRFDEPAIDREQRVRFVLDVAARI